MTPREPGARRDVDPRLRWMVEQLWKRHGHVGMYGDDGEMQCNHASGMCDFRRDPLERVMDHSLDALRATARREGYIAGLERGAKIAEAEPVLPGDPPAELQMDANTMRAAVICTKRNIAAALREEKEKA